MGILEWMGITKKAKSSSPLPLVMELGIVGGSQVIWTLASGENFLQGGYLDNHVIFSAQDWKSSKCATPPPLVYQKKDEKEYRKYKSLLSEPTSDSLMRARDIRHKALEEIQDHEMQKVLDRPNPYMDRYLFDYGWSAYLDLTGNAYMFGVRDSLDGVSGKIKEMYLPPAQNVSGILSKYRVVEYFLKSNPSEKISSENVCHTRNWNPKVVSTYESFSGVSRLHSLSKLIDTYNESVTTEKSILQDKGVRELVFPKLGSDPNEVSVMEGGSMRDRFNQRLRESGQGGILTSKVEMGSIKLGFTPKDLGILESKSITKADICAAYHIPPEILGWGDKSTYNNESVFRKRALTDAVLPDCERKAAALNGWLTPSYDPQGKQGLVIGYNYDVFNELQPDKLELANWMDKVPLTGNERREAFGYGISEEENANKLMVSGNYKLLEDMGLDSFGASDTTGLFGADTTGEN